MIRREPILISMVMAVPGDRQQQRNAHHTKSHWHFTTKDAHIKLKHLYPAI